MIDFVLIFDGEEALSGLEETATSSLATVKNPMKSVEHQRISQAEKVKCSLE